MFFQALVSPLVYICTASLMLMAPLWCMWHWLWPQWVSSSTARAQSVGSGYMGCILSLVPINFGRAIQISTGGRSVFVPSRRAVYHQLTWRLLDGTFSCSHVRISHHPDVLRACSHQYWVSALLSLPVRCPSVLTLIHCQGLFTKLH